MRNDRRDRRGGGGRPGGRSGGGRPNNRRPRNSNGRRNNYRDPRAASESGNQRERIAVESGYLVLIDQFMLANPQIYDKLVKLIDEEPTEKDKLIKRYGGTVVQLEPGTYRIERDPYAFTIMIHPEDSKMSREELVEQAKATSQVVAVDTRCLAMIDRELLDDLSLLEKYQQLWFANKEKACRDLIRDNGGAVRYGFHRYGDELEVHYIPESNVVGLWPKKQEAASEAA